MIKNKSFFLLLFCVVLFISCNNNEEFNTYKTLKDASWEANKKINFQFTVKDTITPKNLFINIRNNEKYDFSNLYLITELGFPNGTKIVDTLQYEMTDKQGKYLGVGLSNLKENKLFYKENKIFPISGLYQFSIKQAMRRSGEIKPIPYLEGIQDVGLSIETIN